MGTSYCYILYRPSLQDFFHRKQQTLKSNMNSFWRSVGQLVHTHTPNSLKCLCPVFCSTVTNTVMCHCTTVCRKADSCSCSFIEKKSKKISPDLQLFFLPWLSIPHIGTVIHKTSKLTYNNSHTFPFIKFQWGDTWAVKTQWIIVSSVPVAVFLSTCFSWKQLFCYSP